MWFVSLAHSRGLVCLFFKSSPRSELRHTAVVVTARRRRRRSPSVSDCDIFMLCRSSKLDACLIAWRVCFGWTRRRVYLGLSITHRFGECRLFAEQRFLKGDILNEDGTTHILDRVD